MQQTGNDNVGNDGNNNSA
jgi:hypothetical protein